MKKLLLFSVFILALVNLFAQDGKWKIVPGKIASPWADKVDPNNVLPEYPRPQLRRSDWTNLNGLWQYAALPKGSGENIPASFQGNILALTSITMNSHATAVGRMLARNGSVVMTSTNIITKP